MTWNYRLMKHENDKGEVYFGIHEVYYDDEGNIEGWSEESVVLIGESEGELKKELSHIMMAFEKEVLDYDEGVDSGHLDLVEKNQDKLKKRFKESLESGDSDLVI